MNLRLKIIKGLAWSGISQVGKQGSQYIIVVILARLLSPNDFGLIGMGLVFTGIASIVNEMGVSGALIQNQNVDEKHYSSCFWINIFCGLILMVVFFISSSYISMFYNKPELKLIIKLLSLSLFITSFGIVQKTRLNKQMEFKKLAFIELIAVSLSGLVGICLAYKHYGVFSLAFQMITFGLIDTILLWILSNWRPKPIFSISAIKECLNFSFNLAGFNLVNYFSRNIDYLLIGKFLGSQELGYYTLAYKLMLFPLRNISWAISKVMFPAFSIIQDNAEKIREIYMKMNRAIALITFPLMLVFFAMATDIVTFFFDTKWEPIVDLMRILCFCGIFQSIGTNVGTIFLSQGRADVHFKLGILGTILTTISVFIGLKWGVTGVAFFYTVQAIFVVNLNLVLANRLIKLDYKLFYMQFVTPVIISITLLILMLLFKHFLLFCNIYHILYVTLIGIGVYVFLLFVTKEIILENSKLKIPFLK